MSVERVLHEYIDSDSTLMASFPGGIHYAEVQEDAEYPYLVYWLISDPGDTYMTKSQGLARVQIDIWDTDKIRGVRLRDMVRKKLLEMNVVAHGYAVTVMETTTQTIQRISKSGPYHYVVDGILKWQE